MGVSHAKNVRLQIKSIVDIIRIKEAQGHDASYERGLLKIWSKVEGYEAAEQALADLQTSSRQA